MSKSNQIRKLRLQGTDYEIAVDKNWLQNDSTTIDFIENRTHFAKYITNLAETSNTVKALTNYYSEDAGGYIIPNAAGKTFLVEGMHYIQLSSSSGPSEESTTEVISHKVSYLIYFPILTASNCPDIHETNKLSLPEFNSATSTDQSPLLNFMFALPAESDVTQEAVSYDVRIGFTATDGSDLDDDVIKELTKEIRLGEASVRQIDAPYIPVDQSTIQINSLGKITAAPGIDELREEIKRDIDKLGDLYQVMNFRGVFEDPATVTNPKHGDIIVLVQDYTIRDTDKNFILIDDTAPAKEGRVIAAGTELIYVERSRLGGVDNIVASQATELTDSAAISFFGGIRDESGATVELGSTGNTSTTDTGYWHEIGVGSSITRALNNLVASHKNDLSRLAAKLVDKFDTEKTSVNAQFKALLKILQNGLILDGGTDGAEDGKSIPTSSEVIDLGISFADHIEYKTEPFTFSPDEAEVWEEETETESDEE